MGNGSSSKTRGQRQPWPWPCQEGGYLSSRWKEWDRQARSRCRAIHSQGRLLVYLKEQDPGHRPGLQGAAQAHAPAPTQVEDPPTNTAGGGPGRARAPEEGAPVSEALTVRSQGAPELSPCGQGVPEAAGGARSAHQKPVLLQKRRRGHSARAASTCTRCGASAGATGGAARSEARSASSAARGRRGRMATRARGLRGFGLHCRFRLRVAVWARTPCDRRRGAGPW